MNQPPVLQSIDHRGIATVTFNRPQKNNAYNPQLLHAAMEIINNLHSDRSVRIVLLRGNGRHFQAGVDLDWAGELSAGTEAENLAASELTAEFVLNLDQLSKPVIALAHGATVGGGTGILAACDIVVATASASFSISEARWGLVANPIFPLLVNAIGVRNLRRYAMTCERFDARRAREIGLVHEVCEDDKLDESALPLLEGLLRAGPEALTESKRAITDLSNEPISDAVVQKLIATHAAKRLSTEAVEGIASFKEKRNPSWYVP